MNEDFIHKVIQEGRTTDVSNLPVGIVAEEKVVRMIIPECCREGWDSCPHVIKKPKKTKTNIGL